MILSIAAPRQVLSRHFQNVYELLEYSHIAHRLRTSHWATFQENVWNTIGDKQAIESMLHNGTVDPSGIVVTDQKTVQLLCRAIQVPSVDERKQLVPFALAVGVYSSFPQPLPGLFASLSPSMHLRRQLLYWGETLAKDDQALIDEPTLLRQLSLVELTEACFRRALPTKGQTVDDLRNMLDNHLSLVTHMPTTVEDKGLWVLVWNILRQSKYIAS